MSFQLPTQAKNVCGGGVLLARFAWAIWAIMLRTFVVFVNLSQMCDSECYDSTFCWESNVASTTTLCYGVGNTCNEKC